MQLSDQTSQAPAHVSRDKDDPYRLSSETVRNPPRTLFAALKAIGPGLILAGAVVGSGELVATTVLGAENGYILLWLILLSCVIKIVVQGELGRYTIGTGETTLEAFDRIPGPRLRVSWMVWLWGAMAVLILFSIGGMLGAIGEVCNRIFPGISIAWSVWIVSAVTAVLLIAGRYTLIERVSFALVVTFTIVTIGSVVVLFDRPQYFDWAQVVDGLSFHMPKGGLIMAVTVFGITGVGASELVMYPYWCLEKGYARYTGPRDVSDAWHGRAQGWIKVMGLDVLVSMLVYTFATISFYLLGAGVLHGMGVLPQGADMVQTLAHMYTETLGRWAYFPFLAAAVAVLYSTVFAAVAAQSRLLSDFVALLGVYDRRNYELRLLFTRLFVLLMLFPPVLIFLYFREPVIMVKIGGVAEALMLPLIGASTIYLRHRHLPASIAPPNWLTIALWTTTAVMCLVMGYSIAVQLTA